MVTVRVAEPLLAVIVTEVALVDCQVTVTAWPLVIDVALTVSVTVGKAGTICFGLDAQEPAPHKERSKVPQEILRKHCFVIL